MMRRGIMTQSVAAISQLVFIFGLLFSSSIFAQSKVLEIRKLEMEPSAVDFKFDEFQTRWFTKQAGWENFWNENSRISPVDIPAAPVNWEKEAVLGIFWQSQDQVIRMPAFLHTEEIQIDGDDPKSLKLKITFLLNTPCFGIITDSSPSAFLTFAYDKLRYKSIEISTEETQSTGCFDDGGFEP
jgi:hypothetical protein